MSSKKVNLLRSPNTSLPDRLILGVISVIINVFRALGSAGHACKQVGRHLANFRQAPRQHQAGTFPVLRRLKTSILDLFLAPFWPTYRTIFGSKHD